MNEENGPGVNADALFDHLRRYQTFGCVSLSGNASTRLTDWMPFLNKGGEAGAAIYRIESGGRSLVFSLPASNGYVEDPENPGSVVKDLRNSVSDPDEAMPPSDVVILVDQETTCDQVMETVVKYPVEKSVTVQGHLPNRGGSHEQMIYLHRRRNLSVPDDSAFVFRRSGFWLRYVEPVKDHLKSLWF